jgi:hypothetical protein
MAVCLIDNADAQFAQQRSNVVSAAAMWNS